MNLIDTFVVDILSEPIRRESDGEVWWEIDARTKVYGRTERETLSFDSKAEALSVEEGDTLLR